MGRGHMRCSVPVNAEYTDQEIKSVFTPAPHLRCAAGAGVRVDLRPLILLVALVVLAACDARRPAPAVVTMVVTPTADPSPVVVVPTVTPTPSPTPVPPIKRLASAACCVQPVSSPDSRQVLFIDKPSPDAPIGIYAVNIDKPLAEPF